MLPIRICRMGNHCRIGYYTATNAISWSIFNWLNSDQDVYENYIKFWLMAKVQSRRIQTYFFPTQFRRSSLQFDFLNTRAEEYTEKWKWLLCSHMKKVPWRSWIMLLLPDTHIQFLRKIKKSGWPFLYNISVNFWASIFDAGESVLKTVWRLYHRRLCCVYPRL